MTGQQEYRITDEALFKAFQEALHAQGIGIHCPSCDWKQIVRYDDWIFQSKFGHGYTCGSGKCPSHTYLVRDVNGDGEQAGASQDSNLNEQPVKECIGRYDECASEDGCPFIVHCILASNNLRPYKKSEQAIRKDATGKVLDKAIEHWKQVIENGKGVAFNHPTTYQWMYSGVVKYLEELRKVERK